MTGRPAFVFPGKSGPYGSLPGTDLPARQHKFALALAIGVHLAAMLLVLSGPLFFQRQIHIPEAYMVNLFTAAELEAPKPPAPLPTKPPPTVAVKQAPPPPKAISLAPRKLTPKQKKIQKETKIDTTRLDRKLARLKAKAEADRAKDQADVAAREAVARLRESLKGEERRIDRKSASSPAATPGSGSAGTSRLDEVEKQYYSMVAIRIQEHWILPELQDWDESLQAILVVRVLKNGTIKDLFFEEKSMNHYFNQFVKKAVEDSAPLPMFPTGMKKREIEFGFIFHPAGLL